MRHERGRRREARGRRRLTELRAYLEAFSSHMAEPRARDGARMLGVHREGPYPETSRAGAQAPEHIRDPPRDEALAYLHSDVVRLISLAPERSGNHWLIDEYVRRGVTVSWSRPSRAACRTSRTRSTPWASCTTASPASWARRSRSRSCAAS